MDNNKPLADEEFSRKELLQFEKDMLGIYLTGHPLEEYTTLIQNKKYS